MDEGGHGRWRMVAVMVLVLVVCLVHLNNAGTMDSDATIIVFGRHSITITYDHRNMTVTVIITVYIIIIGDRRAYHISATADSPMPVRRPRSPLDRYGSINR